MPPVAEYTRAITARRLTYLDTFRHPAEGIIDDKANYYRYLGRT